MKKAFCESPQRAYADFKLDLAALYGYKPLAAYVEPFETHF
jgi:hypothetical protein